jgi:hypothetical protein
MIIINISNSYTSSDSIQNVETLVYYTYKEHWYKNMLRIVIKIDILSKRDLPIQISV